MSMIDVKNLSFAYEGSYENIFENVSFRIDTDWKLGFTGRNGRGKTTFLKLLAGEYPYQGTITASVEFEYFPYAVEDENAITMDIISAMLGNFENWRLMLELNQLEVSEDVLYRPFSTLSNGERTKILLAALFLRENGFLLIDEPTNHLDASARETVSRYLSSKNGFILVSHDRTFLDNCVDHIMSINKTDIEIQRGSFSSWQRNRELRDGFEAAENERLKKDVKRLDAAAKQKAAWSDRVEETKRGSRNSGLRVDTGYVGHKSAKLMKRSKSIEARRQDELEQKSKLLKNAEDRDELRLVTLKYHSERLAELRNVCIYYGGKAVCEGISFEIRQGDRIALCGKNGSGKSSILKLVSGEPLEYTGELYRGSRLLISYVSQETSFLSGRLSDYADKRGLDDSLFRTMLRKLDFSRAQFEKNMADYSGGQKKKVLLAASLSQKAHLYIWDEPLNFVDVISRIQIEELLLEYKPTLLFVEHDKAFCENVATKTVML
ncbi:MAG: ABC-F type ribosomal protection protein [Oscillospiraceae bacterium]|nr:ABC-F type ribosomal protection protein [Oscillospiraceae bacterium]